MLSLMIYNPAFGEPSGSPFCNKAISLLEMSGLQWKTKFINDPRSAPLGKLPVLQDGDTLIADSSIIQKYLEDNHSADFGSWLSDEQRATAHALSRMAEEHLYFHTVNDRWGRAEVWQHTMPVYFGHMPAFLRLFVPNMLRKQAVKALNWMGISRFSDKEIKDRVEADLDAISAILGSKGFLFGDKACFADASIVPQLAAMAACPIETVASTAIKSNEKLMQYVARFKEAHYPKAT